MFLVEDGSLEDTGRKGSVAERYQLNSRYRYKNYQQLELTDPGTGQPVNIDTTYITSAELSPIPQDKIKVEGKGSDKKWDIPQELRDIEFIPSDQIELVQRLGHGAFSSVYLAKHKNRWVALKVLQTASAMDALSLTEQDTVQSFEWEVLGLRGLNHPNVIKLEGLSEITGSDGTHHPAMLLKFCRRGSLKDHIKQIKKQGMHINMACIINLALEIAQGIHYLHSQGRVHRDLKTENVFIDENGKAVVGDLGVAQIAARLVEKSARVVELGYRDYFYKSPEEFMVRDASKSTRESDIYALGPMLWSLVTGEEPYEGMSQPELYRKVAQGNFRPTIPFYCPEELKTLITKCWDADPKNRPNSLEVIQQLTTLAKKHHPYYSLMRIAHASDSIVHEYRDEFERYIDHHVTPDSEVNGDLFWEIRENFLRVEVLQEIEGTEKKEVVESSNLKVPEHLTPFFNHFLSMPNKRVLGLFGGDGMGMSIAVHRFANGLLERFSSTPPDDQVPWLPVFISPSCFNAWSYPEIKDGISKVLSHNLYQVEQNDPFFRNARIILVLEDFHRLQIPKNVPLYNLPDHLGLKNFPNCKLLVTCDRMALTDKQAVSQLGMNGDLVRCYLLPLSFPQMDQCVSGLGWDNAKKQRFTELVKSTPNLRATLRIPSALNLFVQVFHTFDQADLTDITLGDIYLKFIEQLHKLGPLLGEVETILKGDSKTLVENFTLVAEKLAFECHALSIHNLDRAKLPEWLKNPWLNLPKIFEDNASIEFNQYKTRLKDKHRVILSEEDYKRIFQQLCMKLQALCPIKVPADRQLFKYSFAAHFVAQHIIRALKSEDPDPTAQKSQLTQVFSKRNFIEVPVISKFLVDELLKSKDSRYTDKLKQLVLASRGKPKGDPAVQASTNAWTLLFRLGVPMSDQAFNGVQVPYSDWSHGSLDSTELDDVDATGAIAYKTCLRGTGMNQSIVDQFTVREGVSLQDHSMPIKCMAYDAIHGLIATGSGRSNMDCGIRIWDEKSRTLIQNLFLHTDTILGLAFISNRESSILLSVSKDKKLRAWNAVSGACDDVQELPGDFENTVAFSPDGKLLALAHQEAKRASESYFISIYSRVEKKVIHSWHAHNKEITSLAFVQVKNSGTGQVASYRLASSGADDKLKLWSLFSDEPSDQLSSFSLATLSNKFLSLMSDKTSDKKVNKEKTHMLLWEKTEKASPKLVFIADDQAILICIPHGAAMFELKDGNCLKRFKDDNLHDKTLSVAASSDYIAVGDRMIIAIFNKTTEAFKCLLTGHSNPVTDLIFTPDIRDQSPLLLSASEDRTVRFWDHFEQISHFPQHTHFVTGLQCTIDESTLVSAGLDGTIRFWNTSTGQQTNILRCRAGITALHLDKIKRTLFAGDEKGHIYNYNLTTKVLNKSRAPIHTGAVLHINTFSGPPTAPESTTTKSYVVSSGQDNAFKFMGLERGQVSQKQFNFGKFIPSPIHVSFFSKDGSILYTADKRGVTLAWDVQKGNIRCSVGKQYQTSTILLSPDDAQLLIANNQSFEIEVWDLQNLKQISSYQSHSYAVKYLNWGGDGCYLISGDVEGGLYLWRKNIRSPILMHEMLKPIKAAVLSSSGTSFYAIEENGLGIYFFEVQHGAKSRLILRRQIGGTLDARSMRANGLQGCTPQLAQVLSSHGAKGDSLNVPLDLTRFPRHKYYVLNEQHLTPLQDAVVRNDFLAVKEFIKQKVHLDQANFYDQTALQLSIAPGPIVPTLSLPPIQERVPVFSALLTAGANPFQAKNDGTTVLHLAAKMNDASFIGLLIFNRNPDGKSHDFNIRDNGGRTPMYIAAAMGCDIVVKMLLKLSDLNAAEYEHGYTPLYVAAAKGNSAEHSRVMEMLLSDPTKIEIDKTDKYGNTALFVAVHAGQDVAVSTLLEHKANPNLQNKNGETPLHMAVATNQIAMVKLLLSDPRVRFLQNEDGHTPLGLASLLGYTDIAKLLSDINQTQPQRSLTLTWQAPASTQVHRGSLSTTSSASGGMNTPGSGHSEGDSDTPSSSKSNLHDDDSRKMSWSSASSSAKPT